MGRSPVPPLVGHGIILVDPPETARLVGERSSLGGLWRIDPDYPATDRRTHR